MLYIILPVHQHQHQTHHQNHRCSSCTDARDAKYCAWHVLLLIIIKIIFINEIIVTTIIWDHHCSSCTDARDAECRATAAENVKVSIGLNISWSARNNDLSSACIQYSMHKQRKQTLPLQSKHWPQHKKQWFVTIFCQPCVEIIKPSSTNKTMPYYIQRE